MSKSSIIHICRRLFFPTFCHPLISVWFWLFIIYYIHISRKMSSHCMWTQTSFRFMFVPGSQTSHFSEKNSKLGSISLSLNSSFMLYHFRNWKKFCIRGPHQRPGGVAEGIWHTLRKALLHHSSFAVLHWS